MPAVMEMAIGEWSIGCDGRTRSCVCFSAALSALTVWLLRPDCFEGSIAFVGAGGKVSE